MKTASSQTYQEALLIARLQAGEREAFAELYDRFGKSLYSVIYEIVKTESDSENILQDAFVKIWRNIDRYDASKGRLFTWLVVIARRLALDFVRSNYFSEKKKIQNLETAVTIESPSSGLEKTDFIGLKEVIEKLDPNLKQVIDLQYFMGYTQQEVADETGMPLGTVKTRTRTALQQLRFRLGSLE